MAERVEDPSLFDPNTNLNQIGGTVLNTSATLDVTPLYGVLGLTSFPGLDSSRSHGGARGCSWAISAAFSPTRQQVGWQGNACAER